MEKVIRTKSEAFEDGVLTRSQGYNKFFNPFRNTEEIEFFNEWQKGWVQQHLAMIV
ncbi:hypothetical protein [Vibrio parahaemolyticus]|uniref:hypothetical protein n=1 Tax=Vibrio parahaemolyticus TaxID=670 RepID=UPI000AF2D76D|nr:hypothetical protein [Vibrio parahaemolyticus]EIA4666890.1 hypothetical protein [Vibrio parahaemolyticus]EKN4567824.1 hypothetical protein [Vibrio parahaemolyticus]EKZ9227224.1 hypothetical protein [Vibrio parahaemolyticus]